MISFIFPSCFLRGQKFLAQRQTRIERGDKFINIFPRRIEHHSRANHAAAETRLCQSERLAALFLKKLTRRLRHRFSIELKLNTKRRCTLLFDFCLRVKFLSSLIQKWTLQRHSNLTFSGGKAFEFKFSIFSPQ